MIYCMTNTQSESIICLLNYCVNKKLINILIITQSDIAIWITEGRIVVCGPPHNWNKQQRKASKCTVSASSNINSKWHCCAERLCKRKGETMGEKPNEAAWAVFLHSLVFICWPLNWAEIFTENSKHIVLHSRWLDWRLVVSKLIFLAQKKKRLIGELLCVRFSQTFFFLILL
jgi:hypothetical protein